MYKVLYLLPALVALSLFASVETAAAEKTEAERTAKIDRQIDNLEERIKEIERKIHAYSLTANEWKIPRLEAKIESLKDRIAELEERKGDPTNHLQAKIDKLNERIAALETKRDSLDPATEQARIDKINDRIAILQEKIAKIEARMSTVTPDPTPDPTDTTAPTLRSVTVDASTGIVAMVFDEVIDASDIEWGASLVQIRATQYAIEHLATSNSDSATITITLNNVEINSGDIAWLFLTAVSIPDLAGNALTGTEFHKIAIENAVS